MPFTYDTTLIEHRDWIRLLTGDTKAANPELDDLEIDGLLADEVVPVPLIEGEEVTPAQWRAYRYLVASRAAGLIAAKHAVDSDVSFENQRIAMSSKFHQYSQLAKKLMQQASSALTGGWVRTERW